jgi:hypothetical protein
MELNDISVHNARQVQTERHVIGSLYLRRKKNGTVEKFSDIILLKKMDQRPANKRQEHDKLWSTMIFVSVMPAVIYATLLPVLSGALKGFIGQLILGLSAIVSLQLLKRYPLINPIHVVVLFFQWWFGWAPAVCAAFWIWQGDPVSARAYTENGITSIIIVSFGLPLYASAARWVLTNWKGPQLTIAVPKQASYKITFVLRMCLAAMVASLILQVFAMYGIRAYESINYLGGRQTITWWLMPLVECEQLANLAAVASCSLLAVSGGKINRNGRIIALAIITFATALALTSGTKGAIVKPAFYFIVAFINWKRRVPWIAVAFLLFSYLIFVEPFVDGMRIVSEKARSTTPAQRVELYRMGLRNMLFNRNVEVHPNIESVFRGIYPYTQQIVTQSSMISGPWKGESILDGISAVIPRAILPTKAESNMGNFFAHELSDITENNQINIAITIPFEVVGNFGWFAGILSFAAIGTVWAAFIAWALTVDRMTTHPLTPYMIALAMIMEQSVGQALNALKMLALVLVLLYLLVKMSHKNVIA